MSTRCNIAVLPREEDRRRGKITFDKALIPVVYENRFRTGARFRDVPYRPFDLSRVGKGQALRIYCQTDGYAKGGVGETLLEHYNSYEKALNLMLGGHLEDLTSYTDKDGTVRLGYQNWAMSGRDKGQPEYVPQDRLVLMEDPDTTTLDGLYRYLFINGKWHVHHLSVDHLRKQFPDDPVMVALPYWVLLDEFIRNGIEERIESLQERWDRENLFPAKHKKTA